MAPLEGLLKCFVSHRYFPILTPHLALSLSITQMSGTAKYILHLSGYFMEMDSTLFRGHNIVDDTQGDSVLNLFISVGGWAGWDGHENFISSLP